MNKSTIGLVVVTIALVGTGVWVFLMNNELNRTTQVLTETRLTLIQTTDKLAATEEELSTSKQETIAVTGQLSALQDEKESVDSELADTETQLAATQTDLKNTRTALTRKANELQDATEELEETQGRLDIAEETLTGLGFSIAASAENYDAEMIDNPDASNPSWQELKSFLSTDRTESYPYILNVYDCSEFSRDIHNNAEAAGIRSAVVHVSWQENEVTGHAINAFLTTDKGLVFVDSTGGSHDTVARVHQAKEYRSVEATVVSIDNINNDWYWNSLGSYYYVPTDTGRHAVVDYAIIYW